MMYSDFSLSYHKGELLLGGKFVPAGTVACMALNMSKETVARMEALYRSRSNPQDRSELREALFSLDCVRASADLLPDDCSLIFDELICFRVYIRHFLQKYRVQEDCADAWEAFLENLDSLAAQIGRADNIARTVLYPDFRDVSVSLRLRNGALCENIQAGFGQLLLFDLLRALEYQKPPKRCPCCERWFIPERANEVYCGNIAPDSNGRTCREIGAGRAFSQRTAENEAVKLCRTVCGRIYTRRSRGQIEAEEAERLIAQCRDLRDRAQKGELSFEELESQLNELTKK